MTRKMQKVGVKGSQKWLQIAVNDKPNIINQAICKALSIPDNSVIDWLSPLKTDDYAEYNDNAFIQRLGLKLAHQSLSDFWPYRGSVWDGLARLSDGTYLIVEAKAHLGEIGTTSTRAKAPKSLALIQKSLNQAKGFFGVQTDIDWSQTHYQYANRLAHLYFLRHINDLPVYLLFVYFTNNPHEFADSASQSQWESKINVVHQALGLSIPPSYVLDAFVDVNDLK